MDVERSYDFVAFPSDNPPHAQLKGHDRLDPDFYHGELTLTLTALTPISISAGITALGSDLGETVPLIKVMGQDQNGAPILQGTSLKGCIRAVYETITNSRLGVKGKVVPQERAPLPLKNQSIRRGDSLSPAELVFGALGFQGLISIADAVGDRPLELGYLPPMFEPKYGSGRKFYRHQNANGSEMSSLAAVQQAPTGTVFATTLHFSNLSLAQLGALLIALGLDPKHRFALKLGAGKGKGLGSAIVNLVNANITTNTTLKSRYLDYQLTKQPHTARMSADAIKAAHNTNLIHREQLISLHRILQHPEVTQ